MATAAPPPGRWLFGPVPDLLLGCGLLYVAVFAVYAVGGAEVRTSEVPYLFPLLVLVFSTPHYGATLLRVYEERSSRRAYTLFAVHATLVVVAVLDPALVATAHRAHTLLRVVFVGQLKA